MPAGRHGIPVCTAAVQLRWRIAEDLLGKYHELTRLSDDRQERLLPRALEFSRQLHPPLGVGVDG